jgi:SOS-response transcriptional repressor LexA
LLRRTAGDVMREIGVASGDLVLIDRAVPPSHGHAVN